MDAYTNIEQAAHESAYGHNLRPMPSVAQQDAGNYKKGRKSVAGIPVVIENPRGSQREWRAADGTSGANLMKFHYGYIEGVTGADGDELDCYVGPYPESGAAYVVNQGFNGAFDEHKVMLGFPDQRTAEAGYLSNFNAGWPGLMGCVPCSLDQLRWWMANGDLSKPLTKDQLPQEEKKPMQKVLWDSAHQPRGKTVAQVLYELRAHDGADGLMFDPVCMADIMDDADGIVTLDALVVPYAKLPQRMAILQRVMNRKGGDLSVVSVQISDPFTQKGTTNVAAVFELSDGQTVTIFFHNPDVTPKKIMSTDEVVSWKWMLNKKDVTIVVAPERGRDLNVQNVAARVMTLASRNSSRFAQTNAKRADRMANIASLQKQYTDGEVTLAALNTEITELESAVALKKVTPVVKETDQVKPVITDVTDTTDTTGTTDPVIAPTPDPAPEPTPAFDPTTPENYQSVLDNTDLQEQYQDQLDAFFQGRLADVRTALRALGFEGDGADLAKDGVTAAFSFDKVGAGSNVIGYAVTVGLTYLRDYLTSTAADFAESVNNAVAAQVQSIADTAAASAATDAAGPVLTAAGFANPGEKNEWVKSVTGADGNGLSISIRVSGVPLMFRVTKIVTFPGITGASQDIGTFDDVQSAITTAQAELDAFVPQSEPLAADAAEADRIANEQAAAAAEAEAARVAAEQQAAADEAARIAAETPPAAVGAPDITYRAVDDMFTAFYPETPAGEEAWKRIAEHTDGTGKVLNQQVESTVEQLREAGYVVAEAAAVPENKEVDDILAALTEPGAPAVPSEPEPPHKSELVLDALTEFGWTRDGMTASKNVGGAAPGELNPDGDRIVHAQYNDGGRQRFLFMVSGFDEVLDIDTRDGEPHDLALSFDTRTMEWAANTAYQAPAPAIAEPLLDPEVEPVLISPPILESEPVIEPPAPDNVVTSSPSDETMLKYIAIATDSIEKLRRIDVYRVLDALPADNPDGLTRAALATWIVTKRPDLLQEVTSVMAEEWPGDGWAAPTAAEPVATLTEPLPEGVTVVPPVVPAENGNRAADLDFLKAVEAQSIDMMADGVAERIETTLGAYPGDSEVEAAVRAAVASYTDYMTKAIGG